MSELGSSKGMYKQQQQRPAVRASLEGLDAKSSWSSFDDITWDAFGETDDHSVPDQAPWAQSGGFKKKEAGSKLGNSWRRDDGLSRGVEEVLTMDVGNWDVADLGAVPDSLLPGSSNSLKEEASDAFLSSDVDLCLDDQVYNEEAASAATSVCQFAFSDVATAAEGDIGLFGGENEVDKGGTLMQYNWGNLDDMDDLFQNADASFSQDAIQWASSDSGKTTAELRAMKGKSREEDVKMEFIPCDSFEAKDFCASNSEDDITGAAKSDVLGTKDSSDSNKMLEIPEHAMKKGEGAELQVQADGEDNKVHSAKRQAANRKDRPKKPKKSTSEHVNHQHLQQQQQQQHQQQQHQQFQSLSSSNIEVYPQLLSPSMLGGSPRPQSLPYLPPSYGMVHHSQYLASPSQQPVAYSQHFELDHMGRPPPVSGSNMTPQEKIEKLRWKQKMKEQQAKQTQLRNELISDEGDGKMVDSVVLNQLLGIMSKLDVGTRVRIRDSLYRLARSAIYRHAADGSSSSSNERSSSERNSLRKQLRFPPLETVTNPIDRTVANLLFHRRAGGSDTMPWSWQQQQEQQRQQQQQENQTQGLQSSDGEE